MDVIPIHPYFPSLGKGETDIWTRRQDECLADNFRPAELWRRLAAGYLRSKLIRCPISDSAILQVNNDNGAFITSSPRRHIMGMISRCALGRGHPVTGRKKRTMGTEFSRPGPVDFALGFRVNPRCRFYRRRHRRLLNLQNWAGNNKCIYVSRLQ